ncbi:hypothetical protein FQZ97_859490 [compost metagenome]
MVEQHFIVVVVVVIEGHLERARIALHWPRSEGADHEAIGDEGGVRRWRQVVAMAHQRTDIAPVEPHHAVVAMPADHIQRVVGVSHGADLVAPLDPQLPGAFVLLGLERLVQPWIFEHRGIEDRLGSEQALVRQLVGAIAAFDQQHEGRLAGLDTPGGATRDHQVVTIAVAQVTEIAEELPCSLMDEQQVIAIGVAHQMAHGAVGLPDAQLHLGVMQGQRRLQRTVALAGDVVEVEGVRA